jgi:hypothetical protein
VRRIVTSPALLESTLLVFAYGLDLFSTRTAPSKTFEVLNKAAQQSHGIQTLLEAEKDAAEAVQQARQCTSRERGAPSQGQRYIY